MATLPLDMEELASSKRSMDITSQNHSSSGWPGFPPETRLGHMHLTVTNLDVSQQFYESLGLHITANWGPFRFLSYDGYHHHVAINLAAGHHAAPISAAVAGLASFSLERSTVQRNLSDPSHILIHLPTR